MLITNLYRNTMYKQLCNVCRCYRTALSKRRLNYVRVFSTETDVKLRFNNMSLSKYLNSVIRFKGPITVSEYMKEALTNPLCGYYMNKDVFGAKGDFVTSPEINQLFGEIIAVWIINEWKKIYGQKPLYLIELGPGRGAMMSDILRVFKKLNLLEDLSCHLVEVSPEMCRLQAKYLKVKLEECHDDTSQCFQRGTTESGVPVYWYNHLKSIPPEFSVIVAHEFFDALPIHKFKKTDKGWREVLIVPDPNDKEEKKFQYVVAASATPNSKIFVKKSETREEIEVSPQSGIVMNELATRLEEYGGFALIADYGHNGELTDTFRAYKGHTQQDPLLEPGSADLTADVDFSYLKENTLNKLIPFGPVTQRDFLMRNHIDVRLKMLLESCKDDTISKLINDGYRIMMDPNEMGNRFKFMAFFPEVLESHLKRCPVSGFTD